MLSSTPVTVTGWPVFQFAVVKVSVAGDTVAALPSADASATVTSAVGRLARATL